MWGAGTELIDAEANPKHLSGLLGRGPCQIGAGQAHRGARTASPRNQHGRFQRRGRGRQRISAKGIGGALVRFVEERILRDTPNVFLCVSSFNEGAKRFYERLGYEVVGELRDMLIPGHSEILMRRSTGPISEFRRGT